MPWKSLVRVRYPPVPPLWYYNGMSDEKKKPGPEADHLKLEGDWQEKLGQAVLKKKPEGGWPKTEPKKQEKHPKKG